MVSGTISKWEAEAYEDKAMRAYAEYEAKRLKVQIKILLIIILIFIGVIAYLILKN